MQRLDLSQIDTVLLKIQKSCLCLSFMLSSLKPSTNATVLLKCIRKHMERNWLYLWAGFCADKAVSSCQAEQNYTVGFFKVHSHISSRQHFKSEIVENNIMGRLNFTYGQMSCSLFAFLVFSFVAVHKPYILICCYLLITILLRKLLLINNIFLLTLL